MWVTFFALVTAASVWLSAANLAIQLRQDQSHVNAVIESHRQPRDGNHQVSALVPPGTISPITNMD